MLSPNQTRKTSLLSDSGLRRHSFSVILITLVARFIATSPGSQDRLQLHKQSLLLGSRIREPLDSCDPYGFDYWVVIISGNVTLLLFKLRHRFLTPSPKYSGSGQISHA